MSAMIYYATLRHHSIATAPEVEILANDRPGAKRAAMRRFGTDRQDYEVWLFNSLREPIAKRRLGDSKWITLDE